MFKRDPRTDSIMFKRDPLTAQIGVEMLPLEVGYLPPYFERKAEAELKETNEAKLQGIRMLKDAFEGDNLLKSINFDEDFLVAHLRTRKYNITKTFKAIKSFVALTLKNPMMFSNYHYEETVRSLTKEICTMLPYRCQDGCAIMYVQLGKWNTEGFTIEEVKRMLVLLLMQAAQDPMTQVNGFKAIIDVDPGDLCWMYFRECTVQNLYLLYHATQECVPGRFKGVHVMNFTLPFLAVWMIIKPFMSRKLRSRIHFHKSNEEIFDYLPRAIVPEKYGGEFVNCFQTDWLQKVMTPERMATMGGGVLRST